MNKTFPGSKKYVFKTTDALIEERLRSQLKNDKPHFTMEQVLGKCWDDEYTPFHALYKHLKSRQNKTAAEQMGKLFKKVCKRLGLASHQIPDGKGRKHTEYYFSKPSPSNPD